VLLNTLIAVVVDAYASAKDRTTDEDMWLSRLDFVTEVVILQKIMLTDADKRPTTNTVSSFFSKVWNSVMSAFEDKRSASEKSIQEFTSCALAWLVVRFFSFLILALWVVFGVFIPFFLPREVRQWLWKSSKEDHLIKEMNEHMIQNMNEQIKNLSSRNDQMKREMNEKMDKLLGFIQQLLKEKLAEESISESINQHDVMSDVQC
jgi:hypothetical protein